MKSKLTFLAMIMAVLFVFAGVNQAQASGTRCNSLTIYDAPQYVMAETLMWFWNPASITLFPPLLSTTWDVSSNTDGKGVLLLSPVPNFYMLISAVGATNALHAYGTIATSDGSAMAAAGINAADYTTNALGQNVPDLFGAGAPGLALTNVSLTFAYRIGVISVGLELGIGYTDSTMNYEDDKFVLYEPQVKLGAFIPFSRALNMDVALHAKFPVLSADTEDYTYGSDGVNYDLTIAARLNIQVAQMHQFHIWFQYNGKNLSTTYEDERSGSDNYLDATHTNHNIKIGFSDEMKFSAYALAFVGFDLDIDATLDEYEGEVGGVDYENKTPLDSDIVGKIRFGGETYIWKTLQFRLGCTHKFLVYSEQGNASTNGSTSEINYSAAVGVGFSAKLGDMLFEFNLDKQIFTEGPYFLTGASADGTDNNFAADVTFTYLLPVQKAAPAASNEEK